MGDGNRLYMCGTNAHSPKDWVIYVSIRVFVLHFPRLFHEPSLTGFRVEGFFSVSNAVCRSVNIRTKLWQGDRPIFV